MGKWLDKYQDGGTPVKKKFLQPGSMYLPSVKNKKTGMSNSEVSISIGGENGEPAYLIPSFKYGRPLDDPISEFKKTGEHLGGPYKTWEDAEEFGKVRHKYVEEGKKDIPIPIPTRGMKKGGNIPKAQFGRKEFIPVGKQPESKWTEDSSEPAVMTQDNRTNRERAESAALTDKVNTEQISPLKLPLVYLNDPMKIVGDFAQGFNPNRNPLPTTQEDRKKIAMSKYFGGKEGIPTTEELGWLDYAPGAALNVGMATVAAPKLNLKNVLNEALNPLAVQEESLAKKQIKSIVPEGGFNTIEEANQVLEAVGGGAYSEAKIARMLKDSNSNYSLGDLKSLMTAGSPTKYLRAMNEMLLSAQHSTNNFKGIVDDLTKLKPYPKNTIINKSELSKKDAIKAAKGESKEILESLTDKEFKETVIKPGGEVVKYDANPELYSGTPKRDEFNMFKDEDVGEYVSAFNKNIANFNDIITKNNKSGTPYKALRLSPDGGLWFQSDKGFSNFSTGITPGKFTGEISDKVSDDYFSSVPGLSMRNTGKGVFGDGKPIKGTGAYKSINEYLKTIDLGRVKSGNNSQTIHSKKAWENAVKKGDAEGYYPKPGVVHGIMKKNGGNLPKAQNGDNISVEDYRQQISEGDYNIDTPYNTSTGVPQTELHGNNCINGVCTAINNTLGEESPLDRNYIGNMTFEDNTSKLGYYPVGRRQIKGFESGDIVQYQSLKSSTPDKWPNAKPTETFPYHSSLIVKTFNSPEGVPMVTLANNSGTTKMKEKDFTQKEILNRVRGNSQYPSGATIQRYNPDKVALLQQTSAQNRAEIEGENEYAESYINSSPTIDTGDTSVKTTATEVASAIWNPIDKLVDLYKQNQVPKELSDIFTKNYQKIGKTSNVPPEVLNEIFTTQVGLAKQESRFGTSAKKSIKDAIPTSWFPSLRNVKDALKFDAGKVPGWITEYYDANVNGVKSDYANKREFSKHIKEKYGDVLTSKFSNQDKKSKGMFQQKELSPRGIYLGGNFDTTEGQFLASIGLMLDNYHKAKKSYPGAPSSKVRDIATLMHNSPQLASIPEYVNYFIMRQDSDYVNKVRGDRPTSKENLALNSSSRPVELKNGGWLDKYGQGNVIEDDRGQWAHPGEVTKINSNNITMKGVDYPVLGISDTGDRQLMQPGQEYSFKGKSVTEYPLKARTGKWLDKYN